MQIASQTLREARGVASHLGHLCRAVILTLTILCFSISPNNREGPESSHCIHLKSMASPAPGPIDLHICILSRQMTSRTIGVETLWVDQIGILNSKWHFFPLHTHFPYYDNFPSQTFTQVWVGLKNVASISAFSCLFPLITMTSTFNIYIYIFWFFSDMFIITDVKTSVWAWGSWTLIHLSTEEGTCLRSRLLLATKHWSAGRTAGALAACLKRAQARRDDSVLPDLNRHERAHFFQFFSSFFFTFLIQNSSKSIIS